MRALVLLVCLCACDDQTTAFPADLSVRDLAVAPACNPLCSASQFCFVGDFTFVHDAGAGLVSGCNPLPAGCSSCDCIIAKGGFDPMYCWCQSDGRETFVQCALL
jgi:hypothetical protein